MTHLAPDICEKLKNLGYARSHQIKLYGEYFQLLSDPFPQDTGIAIQVVNRHTKVPRTIRIPLPVLHMATAKSA